MNLAVAERGDSNPRSGVYSLKQFSKQLVALWLRAKVLRTQQDVRQALRGLGRRINGLG